MVERSGIYLMCIWFVTWFCSIFNLIENVDLKCNANREMTHWTHLLVWHRIWQKFSFSFTLSFYVLPCLCRLYILILGFLVCSFVDYGWCQMETMVKIVFAYVKWSKEWLSVVLPSIRKNEVWHASWLCCISIVSKAFKVRTTWDFLVVVMYFSLLIRVCNHVSLLFFLLMGQMRVACFKWWTHWETSIRIGEAILDPFKGCRRAGCSSFFINQAWNR